MSTTQFQFVKVDVAAQFAHLDDRFQEFHEHGERTMMIEEIANLRDQVILHEFLQV